jgi:hypothetical protein
MGETIYRPAWIGPWCQNNNTDDNWWQPDVLAMYQVRLSIVHAHYPSPFRSLGVTLYFLS